MNKWGNNLKAGISLLCFAIIVFTSSCDKYTRHEVLTFFFTGVPHPDEEKEVPGVSVEKIKRKPIPEAEYFVHGPHAAKQCYQCHTLSTTFEFSKTGRKEIGGIPKLGLGVEGQIPGMLVTPLKDLCIECHVPKHGFARAAHWLDKAPVADDSCTFCHDPHQSPFRYMLRKEI